MRRRLLSMAAGLALLGLDPVPAAAQWFYPGRMGGYGWSQWGADPASGYMAGAGAYARGRGIYNLQTAQAQSIERDSLIKWNKAMAEQNKVLAAEKAKQDAQDAARKSALSAQERAMNGTTLNQLLDQILNVDPSGSRSGAARTPIPVDDVLEIPFVSATESVTICLDQMRGQDAWPMPLLSPALDPERRALGTAVDRALAEDGAGDVKPDTVKAVRDAVLALQADFEKTVPSTTPGYDDADVFLKSLAGLSGMLQNPRLQPVLAELKTLRQPVPVGDLVRFMHSFNLRFGPAVSDRQRDLYSRLVPALEGILAEAGPAAPVPAGQPSPLPAAARDVFGSMSWDDFRAHAKSQ